MTKLVFIDTETLGLDPERHELWEVAMIVREDGTDTEWVWQFEVRHLGDADPIALRINRYHERAWPDGFTIDDYDCRVIQEKTNIYLPWDQMTEEDKYTIDSYKMRAWAQHFVKLTYDAHFFGIVPSFDEERLHTLVRNNNQTPMWHYQVHDVEDMAWAYLRATHPDVEFGLPLSGKKLLSTLDLDYNSYDRHTALGDARMARDVYDKVMSKE
jgi:DNA polymerase III epsilon subunit-like protein